MSTDPAFDSELVFYSHSMEFNIFIPDLRVHGEFLKNLGSLLHSQDALKFYSFLQIFIRIFMKFTPNSMIVLDTLLLV